MLPLVNRAPQKTAGGTLNAKMINDPTIIPSDDVTGQVNAPLPADSFFSITVDTSDPAITTPQQIVLFDPSQGYQLANGWTLPANVVISGVTADYQFMLNDLSHNASYIDVVKIKVSAKEDQQFARPLAIYESSKGGAPRLIRNLYPEKGITETQFQSKISTFKTNLILTNRNALVYTQEHGIVVTFSFYQKAELGRKV